MNSYSKYPINPAELRTTQNWKAHLFATNSVFEIGFDANKTFGLTSSEVSQSKP